MTGETARSQWESGISWSQKTVRERRLRDIYRFVMVLICLGLDPFGED